MYHGSCTDKVNTFTSIDFYSIFYRRINQTLKSGPDYNRPVAGVSSLVGHPAGDAYFWLCYWGWGWRAQCIVLNVKTIMCKYNARIVVFNCIIYWFHGPSYRQGFRPGLGLGPDRWKYQQDKSASLQHRQNLHITSCGTLHSTDY